MSRYRLHWIGTLVIFFAATCVLAQGAKKTTPAPKKEQKASAPITAVAKEKEEKEVTPPKATPVEKKEVAKKKKPEATTLPSPRELYDHDFHEKPLSKAEVDCTFCHPFKLDWEERTADLQVEYEELFVKPLDELCHNCHRKEGRIRSEVFVCTLCHTDTERILPDDHKSGWKRRHGLVRYQPMECRNCHEDSYCIDCHRRFEPIRPKVHSRNYKFFHSIEARISPASCYSCHRQAVCVECHLGGSGLR